jgi:hypothetical protein
LLRLALDPSLSPSSPVFRTISQVPFFQHITKIAADNSKESPDRPGVELRREHRHNNNKDNGVRRYLQAVESLTTTTAAGESTEDNKPST